MNRIIILSGKGSKSQVAGYFQSLCRQHGNMTIQQFYLEKTPWLIIRRKPENQSPIGYAEDF